MTYHAVMERVSRSVERAGNSLDDLTVVAVSKTKGVDEILQVYELGHRDFGENRARELAAKAPVLPSDIRWHFVGALQSNKARVVRPLTHLLHSMDRPSLASAWVKGLGLPPPVLIQVNVGHEPQKAGVEVDDVSRTLSDVIEMGLDVRGLMAIPPIPDDPEESRPHFTRLREIRDEIIDEFPTVRGLSMGMTDDFEVAIEEGASIIRVGRAIFGPRN
jgi:pyridoxal phosphate enzyme (YggS family)